MGMSGWAFMAGIAITAAAAAWLAVGSVAALAHPLRRRLRALSSGETLAAGSGTTRGAAAFWSLLEPHDEAERNSARLRLTRAGFHHAGGLGLLYGARLGGALLMPALALAALHWGPVRLSPPGVLFAVIAAALLGFLLPSMALARWAADRRKRLLEGLPDALDLLVTCTEAGLGLNAAMERVVEQMPASHPELAFELGQVNAEIRAGIDRTVALRNLADRTGLEEISGLVSLISHGTRLGTGVSATLRIYADDFRDRRMQRAEELAATVGTKLIFPLLICLFPSFFVVAVGPAVLGVIQVLSDK